MNFNKLVLCVSFLAAVIPLIGYLLVVEAQNSYTDPHWGKVWEHGSPRVFEIIYVSMPGVLLALLYLVLGKYTFVSKAILFFGGVCVLLSITNELFVSDLQHGDDAFIFIGLLRYVIVSVLYVLSIIYFFAIKLKKYLTNR